MARVILQQLRKEFDGFVAVRDLSLMVNDGEFITLLGPSGCGKTTTLRMVAGFIRPTAGSIMLGDEMVADAANGVFVQPENRGIGMVFQSYAVWPHMTVFDNVAYPLKIARVDKLERRRRVQHALEQVKMGDLGSRYPHQLSGGQQQRVALARAVVMNPRVMLLDEPLSNLDAKLREQMRLELKELQAATNMTIIFVTHDQLEAIVLADRIVVMADGSVEQIGTPEEIYRRPATQFVADFIGVANFIRCRRSGDRLCLATQPGVTLPLAPPVNLGEDVVLVVRPEDVSLERGVERGVPGFVEQRIFLGDAVEYHVRLGDELLRVKTGQDRQLAPGDKVSLTFEDTTYFADKGEVRA